MRWCLSTVLASTIVSRAPNGWLQTILHIPPKERGSLRPVVTVQSVGQNEIDGVALHAASREGSVVFGPVRGSRPQPDSEQILLMSLHLFRVHVLR